MHLTSPFIPSLLLASAVLADRGGENRSQRVERRSGPTHVSSTHWAGAELKGDDKSFYEIGGTFVVPTISGGGNAGLSVWVGLGGDGCDANNLIQAGAVFFFSDGEGPFYNPIFEWYPNASVTPPNVTMSPGDTIRIGVGVSSDHGTYTINNFDKKQIALGLFNVTWTPCTKYAQWIVEDYTYGHNSGSFADFTPVAFTNAEAIGPNDRMYGPQDATKILDMVRDGNTLAHVSSIDVDTIMIQRD